METKEKILYNRSGNNFQTPCTKSISSSFDFCSIEGLFLKIVPLVQDRQEVSIFRLSCKLKGQEKQFGLVHKVATRCHTLSCLII